MPREPIPLIRPTGFAEAEKLFILSYEGERSEKKYFNDFRNSEHFNDSGLIEIIPLVREAKAGTNPFSVKKALVDVKKKFPFRKTDEFWLIIDRDHWESIHNLSFPDLVSECKEEGNFFIAMSNPCFEIWLIMHLKDIDGFSEEEKQKLRENIKVGANKNHIDVVLGDLQGRGYNKRPNPAIYLHLIQTAIDRAKALDNGEEDYPTDLGSHVYKLVEKLIG
jgi:hypothetical protein